MKATAIAHPNIALIKYWGKRDLALNLPATSSLSLTLDRFETKTTVEWGAPTDEFIIDGQRQEGARAAKIARFLDRISSDRPGVRVHSGSNFPVAAGLASSSSAFAALALAATQAAGQDLTRAELSALARQGSGSASRSLFGGFALWNRGELADGTDSHATAVAPRDHWDVCIVAAVVDAARKAVGSTEGMIRSRETSAHYATFVDTSDALVAEGRAAVEQRDLPRLIAAMERSTKMMHRVMESSQPPLEYVKPLSRAVTQHVENLREQGLNCGWTMDAGPNVKVLCRREDAQAVSQALKTLVDRVEVLYPGGAARLVTEPE